jgi:hypothetical protein
MRLAIISHGGILAITSYFSVAITLAMKTCTFPSPLLTGHIDIAKK